jgi:hypothetical protein
MTLFRNTKDGSLNKMFKVTPRGFTGGWVEVEDYFTGFCKKVLASQISFYVPVATA